MRCPSAIVPIVALALAITVPSDSRAGNRRTAIVQAVESQRDAVVNIHGQKVVGGAEDGSGGELRRVNGMGTGVVVDPRGYVVTNYHVVEGVRRIEVTLSTGRTTAATLISHDPRTDLAVIKVDTDTPLPVIRIGTSSDLMIGETVLAVGNAYGYEHTVTQGIISALHRDVEVSRTQRYDDLIQTDASINPGNSGGPLLNIDGEAIAINVAVRAGAQGIGFAIPIDRVLDVVSQLISVERIDQTWHGLVVRGGSRGAAVHHSRPRARGARRRARRGPRPRRRAAPGARRAVPLRRLHRPRHVPRPLSHGRSARHRPPRAVDAQQPHGRDSPPGHRHRAVCHGGAQGPRGA